jgi:predicted amidophosphoribosyltransferase
VVTLLHAAGLGSQTVTTLLERQIETLPQSHLSKKDRAENIQHAFVYRGNKEWWQAYDRVILIDDVVTTGATLMAARAALAPHLSPHLKLDCVALAH